MRVLTVGLAAAVLLQDAPGIQRVVRLRVVRGQA